MNILGKSNGYDNLVVDVGRVFADFPITEKSVPAHLVPDWANTRWHRLYRLGLLSPQVRHNLWHVLRRTQLDQSWLDVFKLYWSGVLGGRPLTGPEDLYFLRGMYRSRFQSVQVADTDNALAHLRAWQQPEVLYQLLNMVYKESLVHELEALRLWQRHRKRRGAMLEFGCSSAPIVTSLFEFYGPQRERIYISDIEILSFHYAAYKFREVAAVQPILLRQEDDFLLSLPEPVAVIFCLTVFEHLNRPLETMQLFHQYLERDGILIFDYINSHGEGLDTARAVRERSAVIDFIAEKFAVVFGVLDKDSSMRVTVVRKL